MSIFNGGLAYVSPNDAVNFKLVEASSQIVKASGYMAHFIIYNSSFYDRVLSLCHYDTIDHLTRYNDRVLTCIPFLATQLANHSNILGGYYNYDQVFAEAHKLICQAIRLPL